MKSLIRSVLFALLVPACGGGRAAPPAPTDPSPSASVEPVAPDTPEVAAAPAAQVAQAPVVAAPAAEAPALPTKFDDALAQGRALAAKGDHARARELFEAAIALDAKRAEPHVELARLFIQTGDRALAVVAANKAIKLAPKSSIAWNTKGRAELARFSYDAAIEAFTKATELDPDDVWAWNNLGYTELTLKKYDDAVEHLTRATSLKGAVGYMWNNLGVALEQLDRLDEARHAYEEGGKLGSASALASRKRLDGVKSIALAHEDTSSDSSLNDMTYSHDEGEAGDVPSEDDPAADDSADDASAEAASDDGSDTAPAEGSASTETHATN